MAFKRRSVKEDDHDTSKINTKNKSTQNSNEPVKSGTTATNEQTLTEIRKKLAQATASDLDQKPNLKAAPVPHHEASLGQLSAQRAETEQQVKGLVQELDRETAVLRQRLLAENSALEKVVHSLQDNLQRPQNMSDAIIPDPTLQKRDLLDYQEKLKTNQARLATYFNGHTFVRPLSFKAQTDYYILSPDLKTDLADLDSYALRRLKETFTNNQVLLNIVTTNYNADLKQIWQKYQETGLVSPKAKIVNLYQDLQSSNTEPPIAKVQIPDQPDWIHNIDGLDETIRDGQGHKIMVIKRREDKTLWLITYFWSDQPMKRDVFDTYGRLSATQMVDQSEDQFVTNETFYRDNGSIVLIKDYDRQNHTQIQLLNEGNILVNIFTSEQDLVAWWLKHKIFQNDSCVVLGLNDPLLTQLSKLQASHLELWPLITEDDLNTPSFKALFEGQNTIQNVLAASPTVEKAIIHYANDIRVSTIIPTEQTQQQYKVVLPRLS